MRLDEDEGDPGPFTALCMANLRRWFEEGWGEQNFGLIDELFAPEFLAEGGAPGRLDRLSYKVYCKRIIEMNPDLQNEVIELLPAGDIVVSRVRSWGTHTGMVQDIEPTGKAFDTVVTDVWKFDAEGLMTHRTNAEIDTEYFRKLFGFAPRFKL